MSPTSNLSALVVPQLDKCRSAPDSRQPPAAGGWLSSHCYLVAYWQRRSASGSRRGWWIGLQWLAQGVRCGGLLTALSVLLDVRKVPSHCLNKEAAASSAFEQRCLINWICFHFSPPPPNICWTLIWWREQTTSSLTEVKSQGDFISLRTRLRQFCNPTLSNTMSEPEVSCLNETYRLTNETFFFF